MSVALRSPDIDPRLRDRNPPRAPTDRIVEARNAASPSHRACESPFSWGFWEPNRRQSLARDAAPIHVLLGINKVDAVTRSDSGMRGGQRLAAPYDPARYACRDAEIVAPSG